MTYCSKPISFTCYISHFTLRSFSLIHSSYHLITQSTPLTLLLPYITTVPLYILTLDFPPSYLQPCLPLIFILRIARLCQKSRYLPLLSAPCCLIISLPMMLFKCLCFIPEHLTSFFPLPFPPKSRYLLLFYPSTILFQQSRLFQI